VIYFTKVVANTLHGIGGFQDDIFKEESKGQLSFDAGKNQSLINCSNILQVRTRAAGYLGEGNLNC